MTPHTFEVIIIYNSIPDKTGEWSSRLAEDFPHVRVIHHRKNLGCGASLRDGLLAARYDYIMYTDGDNQYNIREFSPYLHLLQTADGVIIRLCDPEGGIAAEKAPNHSFITGS